jgi:hypothetical protein
MKETLFRTFAVTAALALSAFAMTGHAIQFNGWCTTYCFDPTTQTLTTVTWQTTLSQCCNASSSPNPCPAGTTRGGGSFQPDSGPARLCPAF